MFAGMCKWFNNGFLMFLVGGIEREYSQPVFTCLKLTIETLEQVVKYVQS